MENEQHTAEDERDEKMAELKEELAELRKKLPSHGSWPEMEFRIMEIEDEIEELRG